MTQSIKVLGSYAEPMGNLNLPLYASRIQAGFPSPADDYIEAALDLNQLLIKNPPATFFVRVSGDSMINAGIHDNDILIVDRSITPRNDSIVIAVLEGELTVKRLIIKGTSYILQPENPAYKPITVSRESDLTIWGVVTNVIHRV